MEKLVPEDLYRINIICPVDQDAAPDHKEKDREIDPVKPPDREQMFFFQSFCHFRFPYKLRIRKGFVDGFKIL